MNHSTPSASSTSLSGTAVAPVPLASWESLDRDLWLAFGLFWLVSVIRVSAALLRHEVFGTESSLAVLVILFLPALLLRRR